MPPASPAATSVLRRASSSEVLPWSTWPMMVTTGGRASRASSRSSSPLRPISMSASATRFTTWPNSATISSAVSASIDWGSVAMMPLRIKALITSMPLGHAIGEFLHRDRFGDDHVADDLYLFGLLHHAHAFALPRPADR